MRTRDRAMNGANVRSRAAAIFFYLAVLVWAKRIDCCEPGTHQPRRGILKPPHATMPEPLCGPGIAPRLRRMIP